MKRKLIAVLVAMSICVTTVLGCSTNAVNTLDTTGIAETTVSSTSIEYDDEEDEEIVGVETSIELGSTITVNGEGAVVEGNKVIISAAGSYEIKGTIKDGQIVVNAGDQDNIEIVLNGVDITCSNNAPIYVKKAKNTYIVLNDNTENKITDGSNYVLEDSTTDEPNGAIFSKDDLIIKGNGSLIVNANYNHGIVSKDDLRIRSGLINITSKGDGIKGKDSILVQSTDITVNSQGDGMQSSNTEDPARGNIVVDGGKINITSLLDGMQAETKLLVVDGDINISSGGGSVNSSKSSAESGNNSWGNWGMKGDKNVESASTTTTDTTPSAKAMKATSSIIIASGNITIDSSDDSVHSNGSLIINNGSLDITSGDDGLHADSTLDINGGNINITKSYEGIESQLITINGGDISVVSSDDGINAGGGNDNSSTSGRAGQNSFSSTSNASININGGNINVDSSGDGIDSNGAIYMKGGTAIVNGPEQNMNGSLDYDGEFEMTGGLLIAAGSAGMVQTPSSSSTQNSVSIFTEQEANTIVRIESESGEDIVTFAPTKKYGSVVVCSPNLKTGETYKVLTGGSSTGTSKNGLYTDGTYSGGTELATVTISSTISQVGTGGSGMMGGMKGNGSNKKRQ